MPSRPGHGGSCGTRSRRREHPAPLRRSPPLSRCRPAARSPCAADPSAGRSAPTVRRATKLTRMRAAASLIALVLVAAACGCGGDDKSSSSGIETTIEAETTGPGASAADVRRTVTDYMEALNADDAKAMCAVLTDTG